MFPHLQSKIEAVFYFSNICQLGETFKTTFLVNYDLINKTQEAQTTDA